MQSRIGQPAIKEVLKPKVLKQLNERIANIQCIDSFPWFCFLKSKKIANKLKAHIGVM